MREKLYEILSGLSMKELALIAAGEFDINTLRLSKDLDDFVSQYPDILSIIATEILAKQRGFKVEETDVIRLKRDGDLIGEYSVYKYGDDYYLLIEDTIYKLVKIDKLEVKPAQKPQVQQKTETQIRTPPRPRANIE
jgi:hypothetical protein